MQIVQQVVRSTKIIAGEIKWDEDPLSEHFAT
jgi:hypothetical protein